MKGFSVLRVIVAVIVLSSVSGHAYAQCANPAGVAGDMTYNDNEYVIQWCDGTNWYGTARSPYIPNAVAFDGGTSFVDGTSTGSTDTQQLTVSFWFRTNDTATDQRIFHKDAADIRIQYDGSGGGDIETRLEDNSNAQILNAGASSSVTTITDTGWHHVLISIDTSVPIYQIAIDGVLDATNPAFSQTGVDINASNLGRVGQTLNGDIADFWMDRDIYLDLSNPANIRRFIDASGYPVDLGADGSRATGTVPDLFLSGDTATWHTNDGDGGGLTEVGTLTDALANPGENLGPTGGLIGWWKLDETAGAVAVDSSSLGNDGSYQNGLSPDTHAEKGIIDYGLNFENSGSHYISAPDNATYQALSAFTMAAWIKPNNFSSHMGIMEIENLGRIWFNFNDNRFQFTAEAWGGDDGLWRLDNAAQKNEWTHVAVTYDYTDPVGTDVIIYINGVPTPHTGKVTPTGAYAAPGYAEVLIGSMTFSGLRNFHGVVDDARIYDRELSAAEVTELYDTGFPCKNPVGQRDGDTMYNLTHHVPQFCNLREWKAMAPGPGDGGAGCSNPTAVAGDMMYNSTSTVMQYCEGDTWKSMGRYQPIVPTDPCTGTPSAPAIGDTCTDGSIYAGLSPDGNVAMYTTPADAGLFSWNDGSTNWLDTAMQNCTSVTPGAQASCQTGEANTALLVGATGEPDYPFAAAEYCDGLSAHGYSDWYLPAQDELNVLYTNKNTGALNGTFDETGSYPAGYYWSSSENNSSSARYQRFSDGSQSGDVKRSGLAVRCVRR